MTYTSNPSSQKSWLQGKFVKPCWFENNNNKVIPGRLSRSHWTLGEVSRLTGEWDRSSGTCLTAQREVSVSRGWGKRVIGCQLQHQRVIMNHLIVILIYISHHACVFLSKGPGSGIRCKTYSILCAQMTCIAITMTYKKHKYQIINLSIILDKASSIPCSIWKGFCAWFCGMWELFLASYKWRNRKLWDCISGECTNER